jgi:hypothetical protein
MMFQLSVMHPVSHSEKHLQAAPSHKAITKKGCFEALSASKHPHSSIDMLSAKAWQIAIQQRHACA